MAQGRLRAVWCVARKARYAGGQVRVRTRLGLARQCWSAARRCHGVEVECECASPAEALECGNRTTAWGGSGPRSSGIHCVEAMEKRRIERVLAGIDHLVEGLGQPRRGPVRVPIDLAYPVSRETAMSMVVLSSKASAVDSVAVHPDAVEVACRAPFPCRT